MQRQQRAALAQRHTVIIEELSIERQARRLAEQRVAELEEHMARMHSLAQELEQYGYRQGNRGLRGQQAAPMIPQTLQVRISEQRHFSGKRRSTLP